VPYKSKAQQRFFHAAAARGDIPEKTVNEYDTATQHKKGGFSRLPEKLSKGGEAGALDRFMARRKMSRGGEVEDPTLGPTDEQDAEYLDEETEDERHRHAFMLAFAGALAKSRR
jgi:hypothetical protein